MNTTESMNRINHEKRPILEVLNGLRDATFKQKQAAVLQTLGINLSRSSLRRLEKNKDKIMLQPSGTRQTLIGTFYSNPKV